MINTSRIIINGITIYRIVMAPVLLALVWIDKMEIFKWLLAASFFTDAIDGWLARRFNVSSVLGAKLDSIGDDLTVLIGIIAMIVTKNEFIRTNAVIIFILLGLFIIQILISLIKYGKTTSFHTYGAKLAAVFQGVFLILVFFLPEPIDLLFYLAITITAVELIEEIIMVLVLPTWRTDVKGIFWISESQ